MELLLWEHHRRLATLWRVFLARVNTGHGAEDPGPFRTRSTFWPASPAFHAPFDDDEYDPHRRPGVISASPAAKYSRVTWLFCGAYSASPTGQFIRSGTAIVALTFLVAADVLENAQQGSRRTGSFAGSGQAGIGHPR